MFSGMEVGQTLRGVGGVVAEKLAPDPSEATLARLVLFVSTGQTSGNRRRARPDCALLHRQVL